MDEWIKWNDLLSLNETLYVLPINQNNWIDQKYWNIIHSFIGIITFLPFIIIMNIDVTYPPKTNGESKPKNTQTTANWNTQSTIDKHNKNLII